MVVCLLWLIILLTTNLQSQPAQFGINVVSAPTGPCTNGSALRQVISTGTIYSCQAGTWAAIGGGGSGSPGGITLQTQINLAGAFSGIPLTYDPTNPGLDLTIFNPKGGNDANDRRAFRINCSSDGTTNNPNFSDQNCLEIIQTSLNADASYGGGTNAKTTISPLTLTLNSYSSGQRILQNNQVNCYGADSDCAIVSNTIKYWSGPINGDEVTGGFSVVSLSTQATTLTIATIAAVPTQTTCNTTTTQAITGSNVVQTVTVASSTNCNVNDYIVVAQESATPNPNEEAVHLTAVATGQLSGIFRHNQSSGVTITPAVKLTMDDVSNFGQDRMLVLKSGGSSYTTGTVASISGSVFTGSGTAWASNIVGGSTLVPGCIWLNNDDYTGTPFTTGAGTAHSIYPIRTVVSNTSLGVYTTTTAGDTAYKGNGVGSGGYTWVPCARILLMESSAGSFTKNVILESNSFTWTVGNTVEAAMRPDPDVEGHIFNYAKWTAGGIFRGGMSMVNTGARTGQVGYSCVGNMAVGGGADTIPWGTCVAADIVNTGFSVGETRSGIAYSATPTSTNTNTKRPSFWFTGAGAFPGGGLTMDLDTGVLNITSAGTSDPTTQYGHIIIDHNTSVDAKDLITLVGNVTIDGSRAGSNSPILKFLTPGSHTMQFQVNTGDNGFGTGLATYDSNSGTLDNHGYIGGYFLPNDALSFGAFGATKSGVSASPATNKESNTIWWNTSVWDGTAAQNRWFLAYAAPGLSGNNAHVEYRVAGLSPAMSYSAFRPSNFLKVNDQGIFSFGEENTFGSIALLASLDPTGLSGNHTFKMPNMDGTFALVLNGTTGTISGALTAGVCDSGTATVTGATTGMGVVATPVTYPGDGTVWYGYVSGSNTVTVKVCGLTVVTPSASAYNVRVVQ
jgi:hypothetical protein